MAWVVAAAGAALGALVDVAPTGVEPADRAYAALVVGAVALAATRAKRWTWLVLTGVSATFAGTTWSMALGVLGIVVATAAATTRKRLPVAGAAVGALGGLASLRIGDGGHAGASLVLGLLAVGPVLVSGYQGSHRTTKQQLRRGAAVAGALLVVALAGYAMAGLSARSPASLGADRLEDALALAREGDIDGARSRFDDAVDALDAASSSLDAPWALPARLVPGLGQNARTIEASLDVARRLTTEASEVVDLAGDDQLSIREGQVDPAAFAALREPVAGLLDTVVDAQADLADLDSPWLLAPIDHRIDDVATELVDAHETADLAVDGVEALPVLLGAGGEQTYLVLFVTPVEARATGFAGNFAELTMTNGALEMTRFGRLSELQDTLAVAPLDVDAEVLARYGRFGIETEWRSVTLSPDFPTVADVARQLYVHSGGPEVDGVLSVDPAGLAALLEFTGPITVAGIDEPLTTENAEQFLLLGQYQQLTDNPDRIDVLESLGRATFERLTTGDLPPPQRLGSVLGPVAEAGHLRFAAFDDVAGGFLARVGLDHPLPPPTSDALAVTTTNAIGNKTDVFLHRHIEYDATWDAATGAVDATVRVTVRNDAPGSGLPNSVIGNAFTGEEADQYPPGSNRMVLSVYSPLDLDTATLDGEPAAITNTSELGYQIYEVDVTLAPDGGTAAFELHLTGTLPPGDLRLDLWHQPLANDDELDVAVEVRGTREFTVEGAERNGQVLNFSGLLDRTRELVVHLPVS